MISRTLGPEFGGSIGTLFFLANVVGSALAITGCVEGIVQNLGPGSHFGPIPDGWWWRFLYCSLVNTLMLIVCLVGASLFAKTSVATLGIVCVCLLTTYFSFVVRGPQAVAIPAENQLVRNATVNGTQTNDTVYGNYTGFSAETLQSNLFPHYGPDYTSHDGGIAVNFAIVFGVLFSGVTGIMAGANMSGELRHPSRSIPLGTLSAVAFTFVVYQLLAVCIAATTSNFLLRNNFLFLMPVNVVPMAVGLGILTATFSTGLSNLIGASRVLEALAKDQVYGGWLNVVTRGTCGGNPVAAVLISWVLVEGILLIGSLNVIAQINSILFMLAYFATNLACLGIECTGAPNFRPTFKYFTWHTCVFGLAGTLIMMFVINAIYAALSIIMCLVLVIGLHVFSPTSQGTQWGSISQALMFHQVRKYLLMLDSRKDHVKFWRPQMLLLVASPRSCCPLIDFVNDLKKGGLYVLGHVKVGDFGACGGGEDPTMGEYAEWMALIDHMHVKAFAEVTMAPSVREGVQHLIRIAGMGAMKPNTIVVGFYDDEVGRDFFDSDTSPYQTHAFGAAALRRFPMRRQADAKTLSAREYVAIVCDVLRMKKNVCVCRHFQRMDKQAVLRNNHVKYLDVWPVNVFDPSNEDPFDVVSLFMLQLSCIINMLPAWKRLHLRVFLCEPDQDGMDGGGGHATGGGSLRSSSFSVNSVATDRPAEYKLRELLKLLRISASIHQIPDWSANDDFKRHTAVLRHFTSRSSGMSATAAAAEAQAPALTEEMVNRSKMYMQR